MKLRAAVASSAITIAMAACAGSPSRSAPAPSPPAANVDEPVDEPKAETKPNPPDAGPSDSVAEKSDASAACVPRNPPLADKICKDERLDALLAEFDKSERSLAESKRCEPLAIQDLEEVEEKTGRVGDTNAGPGFFGGRDVNGDGKADVLRHYSSVDFWAWLLFVREKDCLRYVDAVTGYQVELLPSKHNGVRDVRVLTYPLQGKVEKRHFDGKAYIP